jgi:RimJ/RimL family protein N-acetyltransferase
MYGPVIEGKLVRLRPPRPHELDEIATWFDDMEVTRFLKLRTPPSVDMEKEFLDRMARDPNTVWWGVEHEGRLVGGTGIVAIDWNWGHGTTGTVIADKSVWGKGLGRELMQLRAEYAFTQTPLRALRSGYLDGNIASAAGTESGRIQRGRSMARGSLRRRKLGRPCPHRASSRRLGEIPGRRRLSRPRLRKSGLWARRDAPGLRKPGVIRVSV